jgi:hypothetical protein
MRLRRWLSLTLLIPHTLFAILVWIDVAHSADGEAALVWLIFYIIDWPASRFIFLQPVGVPDDANFPLLVILIGGMQWAAVGWIVGMLIEFLRPPTRPSKP